jgi:hypothetical protein
MLRPGLGKSVSYLLTAFCDTYDYASLWIIQCGRYRLTYLNTVRILGTRWLTIREGQELRSQNPDIIVLHEINEMSSHILDCDLASNVLCRIR